MKTISLVLGFMLICTAGLSQAAFTILEPAAIAGGYEFTNNGDAPDWGLANLNDPNDAVLDTVVIADDGTPGINAQGIPHANEACSPIQNDLTGKIALVYRYDGSSTNDCYIGTKVLNAQNAGAVGVIVVNRDETVFAYGGTADGPSTSIPFAFISKSDGATIRAQLDAGEDVVAFIGNKLGLYADDGGIIRPRTLVSTRAATASQTAQNASEFGFDIGTTIYNYGQNALNNVMLTATVTGPSATWSESAGPFAIASGDSAVVTTGGANHIPAFSMTSYPDGVYTLNYHVDIGVQDESTFDNDLTSHFVISDSLVSFAQMDLTSQLPKPNRFLRSADPGFKSCMVYDNPNGSRLGIKGAYLSATMVWNTVAPLAGEEVDVYVYEWHDNFADLNDAAFGFDQLVDIGFGNYQFQDGDDSAMVYIPLEEPKLFEDDQRYLVCAEVWNDEMLIGYNNRIDYTRNINRYLQPLFPSANISNYFALGFGEILAPSIALSVFDATELGVDQSSGIQSRIFPNPVNDVLMVNIQETSFTTMTIIDLSGRTLMTVNPVSDLSMIDVSQLVPGSYILMINDGHGRSGYHQFTKL